ncbi:MAG: hypothetical protein OXG74_20780 [Acidobacteria bacterium]|nr:hypothetical protein [Acidobacteriota bacterium]
MKLVKHITIALVLCAIPAMAFGQSVTCDDCTHVVSVYQGHGGFIAMAAEDAEMVTWVATCEGVTRSGELTPSDGMVSMLLMDDTACYGDDEDNSFEVGPIMDGGWYWITDATNSAVGGLINKEILDNETTMLADAGDGVTMTMGKGAVLLKETATGRVGLLPNILPAMEMDPVDPTPCGVAGGPGTSAANAWTRRVSGCMMGNGGSTVLATYTNSITGATTRVMSGDTVTRPGGTGTLSILIDLWGNNSGHFLTSADSSGANGADFLRGQQGAAASAAGRIAHRYQGVTYSVSAGSGVGGGQEITSGTPLEGIDHAAPATDGANALAVSIVANDDNCDDDNNFPTPVTVNVSVADAAQRAQVTPGIAVNSAGVAGQLKFTVVCPAASANMGQELVPENPFPTE